MGRTRCDPHAQFQPDKLHSQFCFGNRDGLERFSGVSAKYHTQLSINLPRKRASALSPTNFPRRHSERKRFAFRNVATSPHRWRHPAGERKAVRQRRKSHQSHRSKRPHCFWRKSRRDGVSQRCDEGYGSFTSGRDRFSGYEHCNDQGKWSDALVRSDSVPNRLHGEDRIDVGPLHPRASCSGVGILWRALSIELDHCFERPHHRRVLLHPRSQRREP
ncbi:MAG: hypothetical protein Udaeo2_09960 [Candidatus Udaeobacter sp.]|nr:MAG: hypothetical protein Udaeo2_09960 [Candidatus Udaeobacter sp.]